MRSAALLVVIGLVALTGCGETGTNPLRPREAEFTVQASSGTPFRVVSFATSNGPVHRFDPQRDFIAPYSFFIINTGPPPTSDLDPPVAGTFAGSNAREDVTVFLRFGFQENLISQVTIPAGSTGDFTVATAQLPQPMDALPEIRVEVTEVTGIVNAQFSANIGDEDTTFLPCGDTRVCGTPAIFYFENPRNLVSAIVSNLESDQKVLQIDLYLNNVLRSSAQATSHDPNGRVRVDL